MSYDAMTAHVHCLGQIYAVISGTTQKVNMRSIIGESFYVACDKLQDLQYMDALIMVIKKPVSAITENGFFLKMSLVPCWNPSWKSA